MSTVRLTLGGIVLVGSVVEDEVDEDVEVEGTVDEEVEVDRAVDWDVEPGRTVDETVGDGGGSVSAPVHAASALTRIRVMKKRVNWVVLVDMIPISKER
jgi:hypothetical protein